ncbi:MAG: DUF2165 family protein [Litoreibacter sp.]|nr:DUF2165 family protein [Litoreibacter sp.]MCY4333155.1 DUF2165 family protein [Litoreibacter sp.]
METLFLLVDAAMVAGLAVWMTIAVADNWRYPKLNEEAVAMVVRFDLMEEQYPDDFAQLAHRKIDDPRIINLLFRAMRLAETCAAMLLTFGTLTLLGAAAGTVSPQLAQAVAVAGSAFFVCIWAGFVIGGNYFAYWYCHQWAQSNHFMVMYWGLFVLVVLLN